VWLYHLFSLSLRDIELILAERDVVVTHESIRHWCGPACFRCLAEQAAANASTSALRLAVSVARQEPWPSFSHLIDDEVGRYAHPRQTTHVGVDDKPE
jgi:hypothetical protein